jgi:TRAP-type mannitol/chloroaromatic compound transport system permease small subunit
MARPPEGLLKTVRTIDAIGNWVGRIVAWLAIPLVLGLTYEVVARYAFNAPTVWAFDVSYMLYGTHFMLGAGYTLLKQGHIRTDIFYAKWTPRRQGWVDAACYLLLFFPGMIFFFLASWDNALHSVLIRELSDQSPWRPPIYPFKMVIPVTALLLMLQGVSEFLKSVWAARHGEWL